MASTEKSVPATKDSDDLSPQTSGHHDHPEPYERQPHYHHDDSDLESQHTPAALHRVRSHISTHDAHDLDHLQTHNGEHVEVGDEIYARFTPRKKLIIVAILSFCSFLAPISSTSILAASPEVVETYNTTGTIFNLSNALYLIFMGLSPLLWGPLGQTYGRKPSLTASAIGFLIFSIVTAVAPTLGTYFVARCLTAFNGTSFLIVGGTVIGDIFKPVERGTAYGWFLSGTLIGPAAGPFIGGIIVTFRSWRVIFWLQSALALAATLTIIFFIPETIHQKRATELSALPTRTARLSRFWSWVNPARPIALFKYPNLFIVGIASSSLVWNMYSLLTPIRYVLNPRFDLSSPLLGSLFYIAPGCGYLLGTFFGGRWADRVVKKWIKKRGGKRIPEDRLHSCLTAMGLVIPACMVIYGWSIEKEFGGIPLPVVVMFVQGVAQLFCFPSLNTYCLDVMQNRSAEVVAGNYVIRYFFAAAGSAACLPVIERIGVGWFSTISAAFVFLATGGVYFTAKYGGTWMERINQGKEEEDKSNDSH